MTFETIELGLFTREEAVKQINKRSHLSVSIHVRIFCPTVADPESGYKLGSYINLTRAEAIRFIKSTLSEKMQNERGARIRLSLYGTTLWIGG